MKKLMMMLLLMMMPLVSNATKVGVLDMPVYCGHKVFKNCKSYLTCSTIHTALGQGTG